MLLYFCQYLTKFKQFFSLRDRSHLDSLCTPFCKSLNLVDPIKVYMIELCQSLISWIVLSLEDSFSLHAPSKDRICVHLQPLLFYFPRLLHVVTFQILIIVQKFLCVFVPLLLVKIELLALARNIHLPGLWTGMAFLIKSINSDWLKTLAVWIAEIRGSILFDILKDHRSVLTLIHHKVGVIIGVYL